MEFVNVAIRIKPSSIDDESKSLQKISEDPPVTIIKLIWDNSVLSVKNYQYFFLDSIYYRSSPNLFF